MLIAAILLLGNPTVLQDYDAIRKIADLVPSAGADVSLHNVMMRSLGLPDERLPVKQMVLSTAEKKTTFNVGQRNGKRVIILFNRTDTQGWAYLASSEGTFERAIHVVKGQSPESIPQEQAEREYKAGMEYWTVRLPYVECLSRMQELRDKGDYKTLIQIISDALKVYTTDEDLYSYTQIARVIQSA